MRVITFLGLAALLVTSGCGGEIEPQTEEVLPVDTGGVAATITVSGTPGNCTFAWNGQPLSSDGIGVRAVVVMSDAIDQNGGVYNMVEDDIPILRFEAAADAAFHCTSIAVGVARSTGIAGGTLRTIDSNIEVNFLFEIPDVEGNPQRVVTALGESGEIRVSGRDVPLEDLGSEIIAVPGDTTSGAGTLFLLPSANTRFDRVQAAADAVFQAGGRATLATCFHPNFDVARPSGQIGAPLPDCLED
ncbi:hypothetical protein HFP51_05425 [Parasphingopyxis sp. CP4]|uniref:hypothetical protein n=1 Tax=Parasphingopyxis sp. CP4 TaxID=2724527 RepID=UPI0015A3EB45|nr:hypothetical protein [Parasphingopyxis sp. CP4]QLC21665.1 hypothetical protein HFP51_05425 [Parasphingopyxis sp. CP4]